MEDLNKQQLILLALLVSFVTSIATGIATVSLVDQAPPKVTRVINRVVERTVEQVVPETVVVETETGPQVVKEETIIVREDELITETVGKLLGSMVRVERRDGRGEETGVGFLFGDDDYIVTASSYIENREDYQIQFLGDSNDPLPVEVVVNNEVDGIAILKMEDDVPESSISLTPSLTEAQLGMSVIALNPRAGDQVSMGIVSRLETQQVAGEEGEETRIRGIITNIGVTDLASGMPLTNLFGEVIGFLIDDTTAIFIPIDTLLSTLENIE